MEFNSQGFSVIERQNTGIQVYFNKIYSYMAQALGLSALTAFLASKEPLLSLFYTQSQTGLTYSWIGWLAILSPLFLVFYINSQSAIQNIMKTKIIFWSFAALMGVSLSNIFLLYTTASAFQAFLVTAGSFLGLSLYGRSTQRDLTAWGRFLFMGLIGLILTSIVGIFLKSSFLSLGLNLACVVIFAGLTAYDTQRLKYMYQSGLSDEATEGVAVRGALSLYLNFINMFMAVLNLLGDRK